MHNLTEQKRLAVERKKRKEIPQTSKCYKEALFFPHSGMTNGKSTLFLPASTKPLSSPPVEPRMWNDVKKQSRIRGYLANWRLYKLEKEEYKSEIKYKS